MWQIKIHRLVVDEDFKKIDKKTRRDILSAIYKKLSLAPEKFGAPLRGALKGYWKLRVSDYRVIYVIEKNQIHVLVLKIGFRRDDEVYKQMLERMKKI